MGGSRGGSRNRPIGCTPLVRLERVADPEGAEIWMKWEGANPTGSMKDRLALGLLEAAERSGELRAGMRVVELTGGSTGSSLAMVAGPRGYRTHFVTSDAISLEKRRAMAALGATLEVMPSGGEGITPELVERSLERVRVLAQDPDTYWTNQFENPANALGYLDLGREIMEAGPVDAFVMGVGTGGCLTGVARALDSAGLDAHVVAVEPAASRALSGGSTGGHRIEGIGLGFVPQTFEREQVDEILAVSDEEAFEATRALAREEGLFAGPSSGANLVAARRVASRLGPGRRVVSLLCDTGLRYLDSELFDPDGAAAVPGS
jgi:cysteine synthase